VGLERQSWRDCWLHWSSSFNTTNCCVRHQELDMNINFMLGIEHVKGMEELNRRTPYSVTVTRSAFIHNSRGYLFTNIIWSFFPAGASFVKEFILPGKYFEESAVVSRSLLWGVYCCMHYCKTGRFSFPEIVTKCGVSERSHESQTVGPTWLLTLDHF